MLQQLNHEEIRNKKTFWKNKKSKPFVNKYNWEEKKVSSKKYDWKKIEKNNVIIALNVLYAKKEKNVTCLCFKTWLDSRKTNYSFNDSKWRKMALFCGKKTIGIIKKNNIETAQWFSLSELPFILEDICKVIIPSEDT